MNCSIISIGTEILFGQIINTNTVYLSKKLNELGLNVYYHYTVGDNENRLKEILDVALSKSDLIITTGGLGPTQDDLTKETIAKAMGKKLVRHEDSYRKLSDFFDKIHIKMCENNLKQVYLPEGSKVVPNDCGTAPGFIIEENEKTIISFPGPPKEMKMMFDHYVKEYLNKKSKHSIHSKVIRLFGIGESTVETDLLDLISSQTNPTIATYAKDGEVSIRVTAKASSLDEAGQLVNSMIAKIEDRLKEFIYSKDDEELVEVVARKLLQNKNTISFAESCTGGLIASTFTEIPGISECLERGIVTYSNTAKMDELGVKDETLKKYGAVSEQTAQEMVLGLRNKTGSDICLAVTGIAGPGGGSEDKPVGLVYISMAYNNEILCNEYHIFGNRNRVRRYTMLLALNMIKNVLK